MEHRTAIYARTSPGIALTADKQACGLRQLAGERSWTVGAIYQDSGNVGSKRRDRRPGLAMLLSGIKTGMYDAVIVYSLNLVGRNLSELVEIISAMREASVRLITAVENVDTATNSGEGLMDIAHLLSAYQRFGKRERILAGQQRARHDGVQFGRPRLPDRSLDTVRAKLVTGCGIRESGRLAGISPTSVLRVRDRMRAEGLLP